MDFDLFKLILICLRLAIFEEQKLELDWWLVPWSQQVAIIHVSLGTEWQVRLHLGHTVKKNVVVLTVNYWRI